MRSHRSIAVALTALVAVAGCGDTPSTTASLTGITRSATVVPGSMLAGASQEGASYGRGIAGASDASFSIASTAAITSFGSRADFDTRAVAQTETFAAFTTTRSLGTPFTSKGVTYTTPDNIIIAPGFGYRNTTPVLCYNGWSPMQGTIGSATERYSLFGFDVMMLGSNSSVTLTLTTNKGTYTYPGVSVASSPTSTFLGFATVAADEYLTDFHLASAQGTGSAPCVRNVSVGGAQPLDATAPAITPTITGTLGNNGWYTSDVSITWAVSDAESAVTGTSGCDAVSITASQAAQTYTCSATSAGGSGSQSVTVKVDKAAPTITFSGNAGSYTVDQSVSITCAATDNLSGVASSTCAPVAGPAWSFDLGTTTLSATAADSAGNVSLPARTSFTVTATAASMCTLVGQWTSNDGVANSLCVKLERGSYGAFANEVRAQSGKKISAANAAILLRLAQGL